MKADFERLWHAAFDECGAFVRDTTLKPGLLEQYRIGMLLREPTFCDASYKIGGFVAPHRFLIISSNARCLDEVAPQPWGLCVWQTGRFFKVIDVVTRSKRAQITLLEIPEALLELFANEQLGELERSFVVQSRETFEQCLDADPIPELDSDEWRQRLVYPIGIDDQGVPFPLGVENAEPVSAGTNFEIAGTPPTEVGDEVQVVDEIRRGDVVWFERVGPKHVLMRVFEEARDGHCSGRKYRVERGSRPGVIKLTEVVE